MFVDKRFSAGKDPPDMSKMMQYDDFTNEDVGNIIMDKIEPLARDLGNQESSSAPTFRRPNRPRRPPAKIPHNRHFYNRQGKDDFKKKGCLRVR